MIYCEDCHIPIDSDDDPDCFVEVGNMRRMNFTIILCETCRYLREREEERRDEQAARMEDEAERRHP